MHWYATWFCIIFLLLKFSSVQLRHWESTLKLEPYTISLLDNSGHNGLTKLIKCNIATLYVLMVIDSYDIMPFYYHCSVDCILLRWYEMKQLKLSSWECLKLFLIFYKDGNLVLMLFYFYSHLLFLIFILDHCVLVERKRNIRDVLPFGC